MGERGAGGSREDLRNFESKSFARTHKAALLHQGNHWIQ